MEVYLYLLLDLAIFALIMFAVQNVLCRMAKSVILKLVPVVLLALGTAQCVYVCWVTNESGEETLRFLGAFFGALSLGGMLMGSIAAWVTHWVVKSKQKL